VDLLGVHAKDAPRCDETGSEDEDRYAVIDVVQGPSLQAGGKVAKVDDLDVFVRFLAGVDAVVEDVRYLKVWPCWGRVR